jgi:glycosyltransferase involved in cell wall biosynthesis
MGSRSPLLCFKIIDPYIHLRTPEGIELQKVTIGIPAYNEERNILHLLQSLEEGTPRDYVISQVIICDESSDNTPQLIERFMNQSSLNIIFEHY